MQKEMKFPEGFYWGETRWGLVARPDWSGAEGLKAIGIAFKGSHFDRKLCVTNNLY